MGGACNPFEARHVLSRSWFASLTLLCPTNPSEEHSERLEVPLFIRQKLLHLMAYRAKKSSKRPLKRQTQASLGS